MTVTVDREGRVPENVLREELDMPVEMWFFGEPLHCPSCATVFRLERGSPEYTFKQEIKESFTDEGYFHCYPPIGSWRRSALQWVGHSTTIFETICPVCHAEVMFARRRVGWPWARRWWTEEGRTKFERHRKDWRSEE